MADAEHNLQLSRSIDDFMLFLTSVFSTYPSDMGVACCLLKWRNCGVKCTNAAPL
jgi:hypothetical protein